jgi:hypothetical protein
MSKGEMWVLQLNMLTLTINYYNIFIYYFRLLWINPTRHHLSDSEEKKKLKKGKSKMFISPEHQIKMTKALTSIAEIYGHYFGKKSLEILEEIYKRHRKLIKSHIFKVTKVQ